ncbi:MAG: NADH-quinone oxidoreductase subunit NuoB [Staphylothermus sp.]|nr:NADH-quinone oxidoreductase subunit NuoB [Staphylothermus sp.]
MTDSDKRRKRTGFAEWVRSRSIWMIHYCTACGAIELPPNMMAPLDIERWGVMPAPSPRQADVLVVMGYVTKKTLKVLMRLYHQMPEPRYVMVGCNCPATGGLYWDSYSTIKAIDEFLPVDIWVPGCMPRAEDWLQGFLRLRQKILEGRIKSPRPIEEPGELEEMIYREVKLREKAMIEARG